MFAYCLNNPVTGYDPTGALDWGAFWEGSSLLSIGLLACAAAAMVVSGGACAPLVILAGATFTAGGVTVLNGTAEIIESTTGYNYMRDGIYGGDTQFYETQKAVSATVAETGTAMLGYASGSGLNVCFVAGTIVLAAEGIRVIESIEKGDHVWAWDEETGDVALKEVIETYINETDEIVHLFVNGEEIVCTPSHPFYSPVKGWTDAVNLRAGDILVLVNGEYVVVEKVQHEILEAPVVVYNFQVEDYHTYYVTNGGILVHNRCENHHIISNKNKTYTPLFEKILEPFNLDLNDPWNIIPLQDHSGRHTNAYHKYILKEIASIASNSSNTSDFLRGFQVLYNALENNPRLPYMK